MLPPSRSALLGDSTDFPSPSYCDAEDNLVEKVISFADVTSGQSAVHSPQPPGDESSQSDTSPQVQHPNGASRTRRPRGTGPDSVADPNDDYQYQYGFHYGVIRRCCGKVKNTFIIHIVQFLEKTATGASKASRPAKRRLPAAYHWLDSNVGFIPWDLLEIAINNAISRRCPAGKA
jgi:hypothetical protein